MLLTAILLIVLGILATSSIIIKKKPEAQQLINKLVEWQGWIGVVSLVWGLYILFADAIPLFRLLGLLPTVGFKVFTICYLLGTISLILLGISFGFALISKHLLGKNPEAQEKGNKMVAKLANIQIPLGVISVVAAVLIIVYRFFILRF